LSKSLNKTQIIGRLGKDPEIRYTSNGKAVANISVATTESWKKDGQQQEHTEWHRITVWDKLAEICEQYLHKGDLAYFEGQLRTRKWQDQSGSDRYSTEIKASEMLMLGGRGESRPEQSQPEPSQPDDGFDNIPF